MDKRRFHPRRRQFLKTALLTAGTVALGRGQLPAGSFKDDGKTDKSRIPARPFGKTGISLPILGMGGSAMVRMWHRAYGVPLLSEEERAAMVRHAYDRGIRYFDTARVYGESESIMGRGLKGLRGKVFLATKVHTTDPAQVRKSLETSLEQLGMESVDLVQVHSPAIERLGFKDSMKIHTELLKLRDEGLLRFIGLTTHVAFETVHEMISTGGFDQVLLAYGYFRKGMDTLLSNRKLEYRERCLAKAHELKMAIVAMKVLGASVFSHNARNLVPEFDPQAIEKLPAACIRWVLRDKRVSLLNIGISMPADIDTNVKTLQENPTLTNEDRKFLADFASRAYESRAIKALRTS